MILAIKLNGIHSVTSVTLSEDILIVGVNLQFLVVPRGNRIRLLWAVLLRG